MSSEVDEFLSDIKGNEKAEPFETKDEEPFAVKEDEKKGDDKGDEDKVPFHKNPKLQRYIDKEIEKRIKSAPQPEVRQAKPDTDELTDVLVEIVGNDTPQRVAAVKKLREQLGNLEQKGAERALSELRQQAEAEQAEEAQAVEEIQTAFENLEEQFDVDLTSNTTVAKKERSDFIDFIKRVSPKDSNGDVMQYPDFEETWKLYQSTKRPNDNKRAKDIADRGMTRGGQGTAPTTGKSWKDVDRIFDKLA